MQILAALLLLAAGLESTVAAADAKLTIVRPVFAQIEDGPPVGSGERFVPGETLYFSCQIDGYKKLTKEDERSEVFLSYRIETQDARGVLLQPVQDGKVQTTVSQEDKDWKPKIRETFAVPPFAATGEYRVLISIKDELAGATADARATFLVTGRSVEPSETLVVRNFRFLRTEDDDKALPVPAYRPGDPVWARFEMTGYKLGSANEFDIEYGLAVLREDGTVAYSQPQAAGSKEKSFYPQPYQPGVLNLNLAKDQKPGRYTIVLTVHDNLGQQNYETREVFSVE